MAGRWNDDAEREDEYWRRSRRYDEFGLNDEGDRGRYDAGRSASPEDRSFGRGAQDRVFGQDDSGVGYNRPQGGEAGGHRDRQRGGAGDWQRPDYGGVSPAMRQGEYDAGYRAYPRDGGRFYGDDGRQRLFRNETDARQYDYGSEARGGYQSGGYQGRYQEGQRFGSRDADQRYSREMHRYSGPSGVYDAADFAGYAGGGTWSGGTGGYDYERGYGDGGRSEGRRDDRHEGYEDRARDAGAFFRRTGEKISSWFEGLGREDQSDVARRGEGYDRQRGARGLGPKGYKRPDERINEEAHQRLTDDPWLDASNIDVSVSGGEVTLSGTVENREAKHRAERIVEDLSGVNHVQNNLRIDKGGFFTSPGKGYGDSVEAARMREEAAGASGATPGTAASSGTASAGSTDDATRTTTRRT